MLGLDQEWEAVDAYPHEAIERVIGVACDKGGISRPEFWRTVRAVVTGELDPARRTLERRRLALDRQRLLASLPDEKGLENVQRYEEHLSRLFYKALHELQRLQAPRQAFRQPAPLALDVEVSGSRVT